MNIESIAERVAADFMAAKPGGSETKKLMVAYALKIHSQSEGAPLRTQQRFNDRFFAVLKKFADRHPDYDMSSDRFWYALEQGARKWWDSRAVKGSGVDW